MIEHGTLYVNNGFRPVLVKRGRKWAEIVFVHEGSEVKRKRFLNSQVGTPRPITGKTAAKFVRFLRKTNRRWTKRVEQILTEASS